MDSLIDTSKEVKREKKSDRKRDRELSDVRFILKHPEGRRFIWRVLSACRIFIDEGTVDTNVTFIEKGMRKIGLWLLNIILEAKPEAFVQMQQEHASEVKSEENIEKLEEEINRKGELV